MRTFGMIVGCLIAIAGCKQQTAVMRPTQANRPVQTSDEVAEATDAESAVVQASHETADDASRGPRVSVIARHVDLMATPAGQILLGQLFDDEDTDEQHAVQTPRTRILSSKDALRFFTTLDSQGLARHSRSPKLTVANGKTGDCFTGSTWKITPSIQSDRSVNIAISISSLNQPPDAPPDSGSQTKAAAQLRPGETLAIEGEMFQTAVMEITTTPYIGDLPLVGRYFNRKRSMIEPHQSLYLVTVESVGDE